MPPTPLNLNQCIMILPPSFYHLPITLPFLCLKNQFFPTGDIILMFSSNKGNPSLTFTNSSLLRLNSRDMGEKETKSWREVQSWSRWAQAGNQLEVQKINKLPQQKLIMSVQVIFVLKLTYIVMFWESEIWGKKKLKVWEKFKVGHVEPKLETSLRFRKSTSHHNKN